MLFKIFHQHIRADDNSACRLAFGKQLAQSVAFSVRKMLFSKKRIAERESWGNMIFPHQRQHITGVMVAEPHTSAAPDTVRGSAVYGADIAPIIEILPMLTIHRQKCAVQLIKLKQPRKVVMCCVFFGVHIFTSVMWLGILCLTQINAVVQLR